MNSNEYEIETGQPDPRSGVPEHGKEATSIPKLVLSPPIPVRPPKYSRDQYEEEHKEWLRKKRGESAWRTEQRRRWKEGFADLTGIHYFYLTQMKIKDAEGNPIYPMWRDVDEEIFREFELCYKDEIDFYVFKRREVGLSSVFGGAIPLYLLIMYPNSTSLMTSADLTRVKDLMANKLIAQHSYLEDWVRPKRKTYDPQKGATFLEIDEDGNETGNMAEIVCRQTSQDKKDVTNLEGARAKYVFLDELFLHPYPEEVRSSAQSCLMSGMERVGIMVAGGSAGAVSRLGLKQAREISQKALTGSLRMLFLSGAKGITAATIRDENGRKIGTENFCINGWSDIARAEAYIKWQRAILDMSPNKQELISFTKRYPLTLEEVLTSDDFGVIPKDVAEQIPAQELELNNNPRNLKRVTITSENGKPTFRNDPRGAWLILEHPVAGEYYWMGTDAIPMMAKKAEATIDPEGTERSMHCSVIKRKGTNSYVAIYLRRTSDVDLIYDEMFAAQQAYNNCQNMIERNSAGLIYDRYSRSGNLKYLAYQPEAFGSKGFKKGTVRGVHKDGHNSERIYNAGFDYFRDNMRLVDFPVILEQLRVFGQENTDVIDAIMMCEVFHKYQEISAGERAVRAMKQTYKYQPYITYENGNRVVRHKKVAVNSAGQVIDPHQGMTPIGSLV
jgi:hypothetical protein